MNKLPSFIDCEASSLDSGSYPTEVGWSLPDGTVKSLLINPYSQEDWTDWCIMAQSLTGINRELLRNEGLHPIAVAKALNKDLRGCDVYSDAPEAEEYWLSRLFEAANIKQEFVICHVWIPFRQYAESEDAMWTAIRSITEEQGEIHRAGPDVQRLITAYKNVRDKR